MRRVVINIILIVNFGLVVAAIALPFAAEVIFTQAKELEVGYRWKKAGEVYQRAAHLDPFNARYFAAAGDFLVRQSEYRRGKDRLSWLKGTEKLYERASQLNPQYAEYWYELGIIKMKCVEIDRNKIEIGRNEVDGVMDDFRRAIEKDPYNFRNNYLIGHNLLSLWRALDGEEKSFVLGRLKYVLLSRPDYGQYVYPAILYYAEGFTVAQKVTPQSLTGQKRLYSFVAENNLWQYHKRQKKLVDSYRQKEEPEEFAKERLDRLNRLEEIKERYRNEIEMDRNLLKLVAPKDWQGRAGKNEYKDGNMYWTGTMDTVVELPWGKARIDIMAMGTVANKVFPYMIVELDAEEIGETFVDSSEWKEYSFEVDTEGGVKVLSVTFANDGGNVENNEDRNLYVGVVKVVR